jgi:hypothetical protein
LSWRGPFRYIWYTLEGGERLQYKMKGALVVDGVEDEQGRALFVTSALYHCVSHLQGRVVRFAGVRGIEVEIAARVLAFDTGLEVETVESCVRSEPERAFHGAALYAAVVFDNPSRLAVEQATAHGVPSLVAVQFPQAGDLTAEWLTRLSAAHDPAIFASLLRQAL